MCYSIYVAIIKQQFVYLNVFGTVDTDFNQGLKSYPLTCRNVFR
jgi:hypothetical protein